MEPMIQSPEAILVIFMLLLVLALVAGNRRAAPTILYIPVETQREYGGSGCLPLLILGGVLLLALTGLF
ncbi:MAG TPA: hypothetical protein PKD53_08970 [Chloroflexaceae bacterium]|nr:hypothetical protein [Chloroflexaceae bacterium]